MEIKEGILGIAGTFINGVIHFIHSKIWGEVKLEEIKIVTKI
jgi:hypothetical protein